MEEKWYDIKGFEGEYQISNLFRVRRLPFTIKQIGYGGKMYERTIPQRILNQWIDDSGYVSISMKRGNYRLHRIIYETFVGEIPEGYVIDHKDRNRTNNSIENLRIVTPSENNFNKHFPFKPYITDATEYEKTHVHSERWKPFILVFSINGKRNHIGRFKTYEEALAIYAELYYDREQIMKIE